MKIKKPEEVIEYLKNLTYKGTQLGPDGVDITVAEISKITSEGDIDFGGGEYQESDVEKITPKKRSPDDKYGWWELSAGEYLIKYNEKMDLPKSVVGILQPKTWLIRNGCHHPTITFTGKTQVEITNVLFVGSAGINIKENARLSKLMVIEE